METKDPNDSAELTGGKNMEKAVGQEDDEERHDQTQNLVLSFQDESTECAICLGSLSDPEMEVIELTNCGHRWHLECLKEQLAQAQPNPAQRLVLTGCRWYVPKSW